MGDFGLTNVSGGTPLFMAPEGLENNSRVVGKTDVYSFAITSLLLFFKVDLAIKLLFLPVSEGVQSIRSLFHQVPLLNLIFESLKTEPTKRPDFKKWKETLNEMQVLNAYVWTENISWEILEQLGMELEPLKLAEEKEMGIINEILEHFNFNIRSSIANKDEAWIMSKALSHFENLSLETINEKTNFLSKG